MKSLMLAAAALLAMELTSIAAPTPAAAGWCVEACGLKRAPRQQSRTVTCVTVRRGNTTVTECY